MSQNGGDQNNPQQMPPPNNGNKIPMNKLMGPGGGDMLDHGGKLAGQSQ